MILMRMDRYKDFDEQQELEEEESEKVLSRQQKNHDMYTDVYMNNTFVDINSIFKDEEESEEEKKEEVEYHKETYEEKSYSINDYLKKAHEIHKDKEDNLKRNLDDTFIREDSEIRKLIKDIDEKDDIDNIFNDLKGDNEDTLIGGKLKTDEFDESIYQALMEDVLDLKKEDTMLNKALSDKTVLDLQKQEDEKIDHTFEKIIERDNKKVYKTKKLPIIVFSCTLIILIIVIIIIILS